MRILLSVPKQLPVRAAFFERLELENALARAATMLLGGHVEAYLNELAAEATALVGGHWDDLPFGQRRFLATRAVEMALDLIEEYKSENFIDGKPIERLKAKMYDISSCFERPATVSPPAIRGFYRQGGPRAVERLLSQFRHDGQSFFGWLNNRGVDLSRVQTVLTQLLVHRTGIAHGDMAVQVTIGDARLFLITATQIVREADRFVRESA
jgi:hypothetical protein